MKINPLISVIIPVFNAEKYLEQTLNSVKNQTYRNIEVLCIDDCSKDNSPQIVKNFCTIDERFKFYQRQGKVSGAAAARNLGLDYAKGQFVSFCDADDYMRPDMLESMLEKAMNTNAEIIYCRKYVFKDGSDQLREERWPKIWVCKDVWLKPAYLSYLFETPPQPWSKLIRMNNSLKDIRFPLDVKSGQDLCYNVSILCSAHHISFINKALYCYRITPNSLSASLDEKRVSQALMHKHVFKTLKDAGFLQQTKISYLNFITSNIPNGMKDLSEDYKCKYAKIIKTMLEQDEYFFKFSNSFTILGKLKYLFSYIYKIIPFGRNKLRLYLKLNTKIYKLYHLIEKYSKQRDL